MGRISRRSRNLTVCELYDMSREGANLQREVKSMDQIVPVRAYTFMDTTVMLVEE